MVLVDTSVWIDYLRGRSDARKLSDLLQEGEVLCHLWVLGELMVGNLGNRRKAILSDLSLLPQLPEHPLKDLGDFVEREHLFGRGVGLVDVQLLYACLLEDASLWTHDKSLGAIAKRYGRAFD